jgi:hypothetical protein
MPPSGILCRVALVTTDNLEEHSAFIIRVTRIGELGIILAVTGNRHKQRRNTMEELSSSEMSVSTRATRCNIPEDGILHQECLISGCNYTIFEYVELQQYLRFEFSAQFLMSTHYLHYSTVQKSNTSSLPTRDS